MFTRSTDCGVTWSTPVQLNVGTTTSQGSTIAVNPINGNVYVAWRQFASTGISDAIIVAQSTNAGKSFSAPVQISKFQPFDQGTTLTSIRTNAYPTLTTDMFGFVYVAFSARGVSASGDARIVAAGSIDGTHWTPAIMVDNPSTNAQTNPSGRGHQIMPAMTFANGRLTILYYDLRLDHYAGIYNPTPANPGTYTETLAPEGELTSTNGLSTVFTPYIDDYNLTLRRHTLDLRVLELGIFPTITLGPSVLVSQYEYGCCIDPRNPDIEQLKYNVPNLPLFDQGQEAFLGDYIDVVPSPMFVPNGNSWAYNFTPSVNPLFHATWTDNRDVVPPPPGGSWQNYTAPIVAGAISVENGNPLPACVPGQEGMRNQNIYTAQISGGLVVGAPGNAKPLGTTTFNGKTVPFQRAFPVLVQNVTSQPINVRLSIPNQPTGGTASFLQFTILKTLDVTIPAYSSISRSVFVTSTNPQATIPVNVNQINAIGGAVVTNGLAGTAVFNPDITNPNITNPNITNTNITNYEITNPNITNPNITNPNITNFATRDPNITNPNITNTTFLNPNITNTTTPNLDVTNVSATNPNITNPNITNPNITNPNITNPNITNPNITNGSIQDVTYPITNQGNTTATYTVKAGSNTVPPSGILLQLIINKLYQTPVAVNCQLGVQTHWVTIANITNPKLFMVADPNITNPDITNASPNEGSVTLAPGETAYITIRVVNPSPSTITFNPLTAITPVTVPQAVNTTTVLSNPGNPNLTAPPVYAPLSILNTSLPGTDQADPGYSVQLLSSGGKPGTDTWSIIAGALPSGMSLSSTGLITGQTVAMGPNSATIQVADGAGNKTSKVFSIAVGNIFLESVPGIINDGVVGQAYVAFAFSTTGGTAPFKWTATGLPAGLSINAGTGQISGIPTAANVIGNSVQVVVTDSATPPSPVSRTFNIRVGSVIAISPTTLPAGTIGAPYAVSLSAVGGIGGFVFGPPSPAPGVLLNGNGALTIANPQSSTVSFSVSVHDSASPAQTVNAIYNITFVGPIVGNIMFLTQPTNSIGAQTLGGSPVNVFVGDALNAAVPGATVTMTFNGTPVCTSATLGGTLSVQTNASGIASFPNLTVDHGQKGFSLRASVAGFSAASNSFNVSGYCETGSMNSGRHNHDVLALPNGKVLVAGGATNPDFTGALASAELYDPVAHTFTSVGNMHDARVDFTMTLLQNGKVLITGGFNDGGYVASAEIFDPSANTFTLTSHMISPRGEHTATVLANGKVLIAGGNSNPTTSLASAEIYDPVAGTFTSSTHTMNTVRQIHHADLLPNGKVLINGGSDANTALASAEIYDPAGDTFTLTGSMTTARSNHGSALLYTGKLLVAGGVGSNGLRTATAELYDPSTGTFTPTASMSLPRAHYTLSVLSDGTIFVPSSAALPTGTNADIYNPATGTFSTTPNFTAVQAGFHEAVLPDGTVLLASGVNSATAAVPNSEVYYPVPLAPGIVFTTSTTLPTAFLNQPYTQVILERGGVSPLTWVPDTLPPGITLTSNGILTGTPTAVGAYAIAVSAIDSSTPPQSLTVLFNLQVASPLAITTTTLPNGLVGMNYSSPIVSIGGTQPVSFSLTTAAFPPGLTITQPGPGSQTGGLQGTPTTPGTYTFNESVADSSNPQQTATQPYSVIIANPVTITTTTLPNAPTDGGSPALPYSAQIQINGGAPGAFTYSLTSGSLPAGITLNPTTGALTATSVIANPGTSNFTVQVSSAGPPASSATASLSITAVPFFNGNTPNTLASGNVAVPYSQIISSTGGIAPYNYHLLSGTLPPGLTLNSPTATTITLSGTPTAVGTTMFFIAGADSTSPPQSYDEALSVTIGPAPGTLTSLSFTNQPPTYSGGIPNPNSPVIVHAADPFNSPVSGANITMSLNGTPPCSTAVLSGTLTQQTDATGNAFFTDLNVDRGQIGYAMRATSGSVSATSNPFTVNGFCGAGSLNAARASLTATLLQDGTVLVVGGRNSSGVSNEADIYNPTTGTTTVISGGLNVGRFGHTATRLNDGTVLVVGGTINATYLNSAELYNPGTGSFTTLGHTLNAARAFQTATLLTDGTVLFAGGINSGGLLNSAEIYNPATGLFTTVGTMHSVRNNHSATLLANGKVLIATGVVASAEVYDPVSQTFSLTGSLNTSRQYPSATLLPNGNVLIAGGLISSVQGISTAELYDPVAGTFSFTGSLNTPRGAHTANLLPDGTVLVAGGYNCPGSCTNPIQGSAEIYNSTNGTFTNTGSMSNIRWQHDSTLLNDGTVFVTGGFGGSFLASNERYYSTAPLAALQHTTPTTLAAGQPSTSVLTNSTAFSGSTTGITPIGFNGILPSGTPFLSFNPLLVAGYSFFDSSANVNVTTAAFYAPLNYPADFLIDSSNGGTNNAIIIILPGPTRALGIDYGATAAGSTGSISLSNGFVLPLSGLPGLGATTFTGLVSATPFTSVTLNINNASYAVLDLLQATANTILPTATEGSPYTQLLLEQGGVGPLTWTLFSGTLPPGLNLSSRGVISGTPTAGGSYNFVVHITDPFY
jgi:hypothetical protein